MFYNFFISLIVLIGLFSFSDNSYAQNSPNREIGIRLSGLEDFDFVYKKENRPNRYFRHRLGLVNINLNGSSGNDVWSFGLGYAFGIEKRKPINDKLKFIHGFEPRVSANWAKNTFRSLGWSYQVALGYVLGFQYDFSKSFNINVEAIPALSYTRASKNGEFATYDVNAGFSSNAVALTVAYHF